MSEHTPENPAFVMPSVPRKEGFENAQYDNEAPHDLSGVMSRWIVPEGDTGEEPQLLTVPLLVPTPEDSTEEEETKEQPEEITKNSRTVLFLVLGIFALLLGSLFLNFFFMLFRH